MTTNATSRGEAESCRRFGRKEAKHSSFEVLTPERDSSVKVIWQNFYYQLRCSAEHSAAANRAVVGSATIPFGRLFVMLSYHQ